MMATIFNSSILNSAMLDSAILHKTLTQTSSIWLKLIHSDSTWWYQQLPCWRSAILYCRYPSFDSQKQLHSHQTHSHSNLMMAAILNSAILDSAILHKKNSSIWLTHSFWLNLMMAAILNSAMLDSDTAILDWDILLSSLRFTQKHSSSTLTLTQTNSIWLT